MGERGGFRQAFASLLADTKRAAEVSISNGSQNAPSASRVDAVLGGPMNVDNYERHDLLEEVLDNAPILLPQQSQRRYSTYNCRKVNK